MTYPEEIIDALVVKEDKRYLFLLTTLNKVIFCPLENTEKKSNFCHVNEVVFKDGRFFYKIIIKNIKEKNLEQTTHSF